MPKRVLVVDDHPATRSLIRSVLESEKYDTFDVVEAGTGAECLRAFDGQAPFDLVLLDVNLPDVDGYTVCRAMRGADKHVPIVFVTAKGDLKDYASGRDAGGDSYIVKPISRAALRSMASLFTSIGRRPGEGPADPDGSLLSANGVTRPGSAAGGHVAILHGNRQRAVALGHMLKAAGHVITVVEEGPQAAAELRKADPDLVLGSSSYGVSAQEEVVREVRRRLGRDVFLLLVQGREDAVPPTDADEVIREPVDPRELNMRVRLALQNEAERRRLQARNEELAGISQGSWIHSLAGGAEALFGQLARHAAVTLRAEKGLVLLLDPARRTMAAQPPGFGVLPADVAKIRYPVEGEARSLWNFRLNGPLLTNDAPTDRRLVPGLVEALRLRSLLITPILASRHVIGLLAVADRTPGQPFRDEDLNALQFVAGQASVAVENHRLHEQLKSANLRLQEFDRLKSEFVAMVAHDFRSPLMAIRGFAEMVLEDSDLGVDNRKQFVQTIINETDDLARLAGDTFLITQMEAGHFTYHWTEIDLGAFILDAIARGRTDHPVGIDVPTGLPRLIGDPERLRQVVTNLVSNAVKYSPGGDSVLVRARQPAGGHVQIQVVDHGLGIPADQMGRLFQKFERVRTEQHALIGGTGLGLYICRLITEGHGGRIWAESEPGTGSTFSVLLPLDPRKTKAVAERDAQPSG